MAKTINKLRFIKNAKQYVFVKDNDLKEFKEEKLDSWIKELKECLYENTDINIDKIKFLKFGFPKYGRTFDFFLLAHCDKEIFSKTKKTKLNIASKLKNLLGEKYKANEKAIKKIFEKNENYEQNLINNLKGFDENYYELAKLLLGNK